MSKENQSEKIISDKLNSREFAFDEKAWAGMETLLDAQEKKRRVGFFWWFSASVFVVLVAGAAYYYSQKSDEGKQVIAIETTKNNETTTQNIVAEQNKAELSVLEQETEVFYKKPIETGQKATKKVVSAPKKGIPSVADGLPAVTEGHPAVAGGLPTLTEGHPAVADGLPAVAGGLPILTQGLPAVTEGLPAVADGGSTLTQGVPFSAEMTADSAKTTEQTLLTDSASLAETAKNLLTAPGKETKNAWGVLAGAGYWFPYQSTLGPTDTKGVIGFTGGIYYQRAFTKHIELGLSAVYSSRGALNYDKTITNSEFGFGIESDKTTIAPQTLHYLSIPLYLRFNITQRSHLLVGASYYQLLATTSKVTRTTENSFGVIESNTEKQTGEHAGFRKNDIAAFIGYELTLFDRMNAGLQFSYGFYDNTLNVYHPDYSGGVDKNISLQLQLKYDLIRH